jgi:hypothetical protein
MPYSPAGRNIGLDAIGAAAAFVSTHTAYPGDLGADEVLGGVPPYTREAIAWNPAAAGSKDNTVNPAINIPPATDVAWLGLWSAVVAGVFLGSIPLGSTGVVPFTGANAGDVLTAYGHGFSDDDNVVVFDTTGAVLPVGLTEGDIYFVVGATADTLQLSLTLGGAAIALTANGAGFLSLIVPASFVLQGLLTLTDADINLLL